MKIAVAIIIVAMVARAQGLRCAVCVHQPGEEILNIADMTPGDYTEQDCETITSDSVVECESDYLGDPDVCASVFMTFTTTVDGKPKEEYANFFHCNHKKNVETENAVVNEEYSIAFCKELEGMHKEKNEGITDFSCRFEICEDDGCNYLELELDEEESDAESYVSSETRAGTSIFLVGIFSFFI